MWRRQQNSLVAIPLGPGRLCVGTGQGGECFELFTGSALIHGFIDPEPDKDLEFFCFYQELRRSFPGIDRACLVAECRSIGDGVVHYQILSRHR